jgi:hypothetical protein
LQEEVGLAILFPDEYLMETYFLHQTPRTLAIDLVALTPLEEDDIVLEAFKGEGAFYDALPSYVRPEWCETSQGRDYKDFTGTADWVISNPPYRLELQDGKRVNALWPLLDYFSTRVAKGIGFLINDKCLSTLTPRRLQILAERGLHLTKLVVCSVKKWRGRYYYVLFTKTEEPVETFRFLLPNYE